MTKNFIKKRKKKQFLSKISNNSMPKKDYSNKQTTNLVNYNKLSSKKIKPMKSNRNIDNLKTQSEKSKVIINRNSKYQLDKYEEKFPSLSTMTAKKYSINIGTNLFFNSNNKNILTQKRPQSSYNTIKKEIDINLKSSKNNNSFYNKSFSIQKTCQVSTLIKNQKEIMYENKCFLDDFKDLKSAFELTSNNNSMTHKNIMNKKIKQKLELSNNSKKGELNALVKAKQFYSNKNKGKSYNFFYPKDPSPLFVESNNVKSTENEMKIFSNNI